MELKELLSLIKDSSSLTSVSKEKLDELISRYPWFSTTHFLKAKQAQLTASSDLENILSTTAVFANNRQALFELMYPSVPDKIFVEEKIDGRQKSEDGRNIVEEKTIETSVVEEIKSSSEKIHEEEISHPEKIEFAETESEQNIHADNEAVEEENLSTEFIAMSNSGSSAEFIQKEIEEETDEPEIEIADTEISATKILEDEIVKSEVDEMLKDNEVELLSSSEMTHKYDEEETDDEGTYDEKFDSEIESNKLMEAETELISVAEKNISIDTSEEHSFMDWLKQFGGNISIVQPTPQPIKNKPAAQKFQVEVVEEKKRPLTYPAEKILKEKSAEEIVPIEYSHDILTTNNDEDLKVIDSFVALQKKRNAEPKISEATDAKENSSLIENDFVTETLAKILTEQGKFQKAVEMYEMLSLKYPDKSLLFAPLIKELKKKI